MWIRFLADYDYKPKNNVLLAYAAGGEYCVTHTCGQNAIRAGKAVAISTPNGEVNQEAVRATSPNGKTNQEAVRATSPNGKTNQEAVSGKATNREGKDGETIKPDGIGADAKAARQDTGRGKKPSQVGDG